eukprot:scaffold2613_cov188-Amphora_coffeaeformis.AAC.9
MASPRAVNVVRSRQYGVLRWMVDTGFVDLNESVANHTEWTRAAKSLAIFENARIPKGMVVGAFLSAAAVEYDDLQTLEWIFCREFSMESICMDEIVLSLESQPSWSALGCEKSCRKSSKTVYAVHIAVERGFEFVTDRLLQHGCPSKDAKGQGLNYYARRSNFDFEDWAKEKTQKPEIFPSFNFPMLQDTKNGELHLDPLSKTPIKVYGILYNEVKQTNSDNWKSQLHVRAEEHEIDEKKGKTLLLGRSGTGKTLSVQVNIASPMWKTLSAEPMRTHSSLFTT